MLYLKNEEVKVSELKDTQLKLWTSYLLISKNYIDLTELSLAQLEEWVAFYELSNLIQIKKFTHNMNNYIEYMGTLFGLDFGCLYLGENLVMTIYGNKFKNMMVPGQFPTLFYKAIRRAV
jgi:hypothetical protein